MTTTLTSSQSADQVQSSLQAAKDDDSSSLTQVVSFQLAGEEYGLNIMSVQEIILMGEITQIPEVPSYIRGLINLRGKVIPILDLRSRFRMPTTEVNEHTRIIVVNGADTTFGLVVDAVSQVLRLEGEQIEPPPAGLANIDQAYLQGLVKMEKKIMILLDVDKIISQEDQQCLTNNEECPS